MFLLMATLSPHDRIRRSDLRATMPLTTRRGLLFVCYVNRQQERRVTDWQSHVETRRPEFGRVVCFDCGTDRAVCQGRVQDDDALRQCVVRSPLAVAVARGNQRR